MAKSFYLTSEFVVVECYKCAIAFGMPVDWDQKLRNNHNLFYCPKGHGQHYTAKSEEQKLRARLRTVMDDRDTCIQNMETQVTNLSAEVKSERGRASFFRGKLYKEKQ